MTNVTHKLRVPLEKDFTRFQKKVAGMIPDIQQAVDKKIIRSDQTSLAARCAAAQTRELNVDKFFGQLSRYVYRYLEHLECDHESELASDVLSELRALSVSLGPRGRIRRKSISPACVAALSGKYPAAIGEFSGDPSMPFGGDLSTAVHISKRQFALHSHGQGGAPLATMSGLKINLPILRKVGIDTTDDDPDYLDISEIKNLLDPQELEMFRSWVKEVLQRVKHMLLSPENHNTGRKTIRSNTTPRAAWMLMLNVARMFLPFLMALDKDVLRSMQNIALATQKIAHVRCLGDWKELNELHLKNIATYLRNIHILRCAIEVIECQIGDDHNLSIACHKQNFAIKQFFLFPLVDWSEELTRRLALGEYSSPRNGIAGPWLSVPKFPKINAACTPESVLKAVLNLSAQMKHGEATAPYEDILLYAQKFEEHVVNFDHLWNEEWGGGTIWGPDTD